MPIIDAANFRVVAANGLGRPSKTSTRSMAYFRGALYVGRCAEATLEHLRASHELERID